MVGVSARRSENRHDAVPQVLIHIASVAEDDVRHRGEIPVQELDERLRVHLFRDGRKPCHVRKEHREFFLLASESDRLRIPHDFIHDLSGHVLGEDRPQLATLLSFSEVLNGGGGCNVEWYTKMTPAGVTNVLVNDSIPGGVKAYRLSAVNRAYVSYANPPRNDDQVFKAKGP